METDMTSESLQWLNQEYLDRMRTILKDDYDAYIQSLSQPLFQGLRISTIKADPESYSKTLPFLKDPSPFSESSWYVSGHYGLHPGHLSGCFYLQEPSAGSAVEALDVQSDDMVLDACAAPGSKSTQIAQQLKNGFLVSNEYEFKRAMILHSNLERMGADESALFNLPAQKLDQHFSGCFDRVLVDAPCSGEGMIKKHDAASVKWSMDNIEQCAARQKEILQSAWNTLKPEGTLVYSTCTYAPEENEEIVRWALENLDHIRLVDTGLTAGRKGLDGYGFDSRLVRRIFPMDQGEGHFVARFEKESTEGKEKMPALAKNEKADRVVQDFLREQLKKPFEYIYSIPAKNGDVEIYGMNHPFFKPVKNLLYQGVHIGTLRKKRLEPDHEFFMSAQFFKYGKTKTECSLKQMDDFMHGLQLDLSAEKGYRALCYQCVPFGFGKSDGRRITNRLPKGLRLLPLSHVMETVSDQRDDK